MLKLLKIKAFALLCFTSFLPSAVFSQLVIRATSIPVNTPANDKIHVAGTFNNWDPASTAHIMTPEGGGVYAITINPSSPGTVEFKFTRGSWATVEGNANGTFQANHSVQYSGGNQTFNLPILSWEDLAGGNPGGGTAAPNVQLLDDDFYMPQLNRTRKIWIYLPPDYQTSLKKYPVFYMHDGQNLFDNATSAFGEWEVDESLNDLFQQGDYGCIVVGIANGGQYRLDEYSPWVNPQYGGGQGDEYISFIINTLKPHIDANFRTFTDRWRTAIGGSSMGGLISQYALIERQDVFSKAAVFSPAFWFAGDASVNHVLNTGKQDDVRVYFLAGENEASTVDVAGDMADVADAMVSVGFDPFQIYFKTPSDGAHSEWFWAREFPDAYEWLFQNSATSTKDALGGPANDVDIYPNPSVELIRPVGEIFSENVDFQIVGTDGKIWEDSTLLPGEAIQVSKLPEGFYFLKFEKDGRRVAVKRFSVPRH